MFSRVVHTLVRLSLWPISLFVRRSRRPEILPERYENWSAAEKLRHLRARAEATAYAPGQLPFRVVRFESLHTMRHLVHIMDHAGDTRHPALGPKPIHPYGVGAVARLEKLSVAETREACAAMGLSETATKVALGHATGDCPVATGLLNGGTAILRCSTALPVRADRPRRWLGAFTPGLALKFPIDGQQSRNVVAMLRLEGQGSERNFFAHTLATQLPAPRTLPTQFLAVLFDAVEPTPLDLPVAQLGRINADGTDVTAPWTARQLFFVPTPQATARGAAAEQQDMRLDLMRNFRKGDTLYTVFAAQHPDQVGIPILKLVLDSDFVASRFDDEEISFQHARKRVMPRPPAAQ